MHQEASRSMPTYEYACRDCGHHLEVVQSFTDPPLQTCERCKGPLRKVFSAAGIIFKGSGYYVTDTRASMRKAAKSTTSGAEDSAGSSDSSDSSSKTSGASDTASSTDTAGSSDSGARESA
jgi:putative FmdB family regulatory protein